MKNFKIAILTLAIVSLFIESVWGETLAPGGTSTIKGPTTTTAPNMGTANNDMKNNMDEASDKQDKSAKIGMVVGGGLAVAAAVCFSNPPTKPICYALAAGSALSFLGAAHNKSKSGENKKFANTFYPGGVDPSAPPLETNPDGTPKNPPLGADGKPMTPVTLLKPLAKIGVKVDPKKESITMPDGKTFPLQAFTSPAAMSAAGLNPGDFAKVQDAVKKIEKENGIKGADAGDNTEVVVGGSGNNPRNSADGGAGAGRMGRGHSGINRDPAQVAGLTTTHNGEPIGVASDSIFGIIDRRYEFHKKKGSFLEQQ